MKTLYKKTIVILTIVALFLNCIVVSSAKEIIPGDADGDGCVTASDARIVLRVSVNVEEYGNFVFTSSDIDEDAKITASDARNILRLSTGLGILLDNAFYKIISRTLPIYTKPIVSSKIKEELGEYALMEQIPIKIDEIRYDGSKAFGSTLYRGIIGWVDMDNLEKYYVDGASDACRALNENTPIYSDPDSNSIVIDTTMKNEYYDTVDFINKDDEVWCHIGCPRSAGWVKIKELRPCDHRTNIGEYTIKSNEKIKLFSENTIFSPVIGDIYNNSKVWVEKTSYTSDGYMGKINYGDKSGWIELIEAEKFGSIVDVVMSSEFYIPDTISGALYYKDPIKREYACEIAECGKYININAWLETEAGYMGLTDNNMWINLNNLRCDTLTPRKGSLYIVSSTQGADLKKDPSSKSETIKKVAYGTVIRIKDIDFDKETYEYWIKTEYGSSSGYIRYRNLIKVDLNIEPAEYRVKPKVGIYIRKGPGTDYPKAGDMDCGEELNINAVLYRENRFWGLSDKDIWAPVDYLEYCNPDYVKGMYEVKNSSGAYIYDEYENKKIIPKDMYIYISGTKEINGMLRGNTSIGGVEYTVDLSYLKHAENFSYTSRLYKVKSSYGLNMRNGAGTEYTKIFNVDDGTGLFIDSFKYKGSELWGCTDNGLYVSMDYLE